MSQYAVYNRMVVKKGILKMKRKLLIFLSLLLVVACTTSNATGNSSSGSKVFYPSGLNGEVDRFVDSGAGVVCYVVFGGAGVGIDCMPLHDIQVSNDLGN